MSHKRWNASENDVKITPSIAAMNGTHRGKLQRTFQIHRKTMETHGLFQLRAFFSTANIADQGPSQSQIWSGVHENDRKITPSHLALYATRPGSMQPTLQMHSLSKYEEVPRSGFLGEIRRDASVFTF